ncbi:MAG: V-type ATP synthase subunit I [Clostridia bacterium]|nr:V-type ATP synthase subunit I [Clostridia bacterium]
MSISTMKKLTVLAHSSDADAIVRRMLHLKCVQIQRSMPEAGELSLERIESDGKQTEIRERMAHIEAAMPRLAKYSTRRGGIGRRVQRLDRAAFVADGRAERAYLAVERTLAVKSRMDEIVAEQTRNEAAMQSLLPWLNYDAPLNEVSSAHTAMQLGSCLVKLYNYEALEAAGAYVEDVSDDGKTQYFSVTYHKEDEEAVTAALDKCAFLKVNFSDISTTAQAAYDELERCQSALAEENSALIETLMDLSESLDDIEVLYDVEGTNLNICLQKQKLYQTQNCIVLAGWLPAAAEERVLGGLSAFECACEISEPEEGDEVPVLLRNNPFSGTFEWVIEMYSYPKYGGFDPTLIMSIFYFLIFGLMFADVGYGLLLVLACFGGVKLLNPKEGLKRMMLMFGYCGISCMIMGVLFGGWFGDLPVAIMNNFFPQFGGQAQNTAVGHFFNNGVFFNPVSSSIPFLFVALGMGEVHLVAGMAVNMVLTWKSGKRIQALCENIPYWVMFAGVDLMAPLAAAGMISSDPLAPQTQALLENLSGIGMYVMFVGIAMILFLKGIGEKTVFAWLIKGLGGLYSLISFASDLLSYSRILALGLVASVIAQVINMLTSLGASGPVGFIFMVIVMILGHGLNLAINLLGTFVHAARLQYIEFFGKFYEDGGEAFKPALPAEEYSEDTSFVLNETNN